MENCRSSSSFSIEIKYEEDIKKYKKQIEELTRKNKNLYEENILLKKQVHETNININVNKNENCYSEKNEILILRKRIENCEADYTRIETELDSTRTNVITIRKEISISFEKQYNEKVGIYEKQIKEIRELLVNCETQKVKFISEIEELRIKIVKKYEEKYKSCKNEIKIINENFSKKIEELNKIIKTCETEKNNISIKFQDEKIQIQKINRENISKIKIELKEEITKVTKLKEKCEDEKKKLEEKSNKQISEFDEKIQKIKFLYEEKITKITINIKNCEKNLKINSEDFNKKLGICEKKIQINKQFYLEEKIKFEKIIHEKEIYIIKEIEKCNKEKLEETKKCKKCDDLNLLNLQKQEELKKQLIIKYESEIRKLNDKYFGIEGKEMSCKIEVNSLMLKLNFCQDEKLDIIKKFKEDKIQIEKNCEVKITNINHSLEINITKIKQNLSDCEKKENKLIEEKRKMENLLHEEIRKIKNEFELKIKKCYNDIELIKLKNQSALTQIQNKYHILEMEKNTLNINISTCKSNSQSQIKSYEEIKHKLEIEIRSYEIKLKDYKSKFLICEDTKNAYLNKFKYEENETKRLLIEITNIKKEIKELIIKSQKEQEQCNASTKLIKEEKNKFQTQITKFEYLIKIEKDNCLNSKKDIDYKITILESKLKDKEIIIKNLTEENLKCEKKLQEEKMKETKTYEKGILQLRLISEKYEKCKLENLNFDKEINLLKIEIKNNKKIFEIKIKKFEEITNTSKICQKNLNLLKIKISHFEQHKDISLNFEYKKLEEKLIILQKNLDEKICEIKKKQEEIFKLTSLLGKCKLEKETFRRKSIESSNEISILKKITEERKTSILTYENKLADLKNENSKCSNKMISIVEEFTLKINICVKEKKIIEDNLKKEKKNCHENKINHNDSHSNSHSDYYLKYQLVIKEQESFKIKLNECEKETKGLYDKISDRMKIINDLKLKMEVIVIKHKHKIEFLEKEKEEINTKIEKCYLENKDCKRNVIQLKENIHINEMNVIKIENEYQTNINIYKSKITICESKITNNNNEKYKYEIKELQEKLEDTESKCKCDKDNLEEKVNKFEKDLIICNKKLLTTDENNNNSNLNVNNEYNFTNKITLITNKYEFQLKSCNEKNDDYIRKYEEIKRDLKDCSNQNTKISIELKSLKSGKMENLVTKINLMEKEYKSIKEKFLACTEENKTIRKKFDIEEKSITKKYVTQIEKINKECSIKIEEFNFSIKKIETEKTRILTEKENEMIEIRESKTECNKSLDAFKLEIKNYKEKNLCCKNDLFVCNGNFESIKKTESSLRIKMSKINIEINSVNNKLKTCEDDVFNWREKVNELNAEMKITIKKENIENEFDYSIKNLLK